MYKTFNAINGRFLKGDIVYWHFGEIKLFPQNRFDKAYGVVESNQDGDEVKVRICQQPRIEIRGLLSVSLTGASYKHSAR